jgi:hypothetical protein
MPGLTRETQKSIAISIHHIKKACDIVLSGKMELNQFVEYALTRMKEVREHMSFVDSDGDIDSDGISKLHAPAENEAPGSWEWEDE